MDLSMDDLETLFIMLGIVYLMECCLPVGKNALVFAAAPFARKARQSLQITLKSALVFLNPIPLFGRALVGDLEPLSFSVEGVVLYNSLLPEGGVLKSGSGRFIAYAEVTRLEVKGDKLRINDFEVTCADGERAAKLALRLHGFRALLKTKARLGRPAGRALESKLCADWAPLFDVQAARQRWRTVLGLSLIPAFAATLLLLHIFALMPLGLFLSSSRAVWYALGIILLSLHFLTVFFFWRAHCKLYPQSREERIKKLLTMFFNPFSSMHCPAQLCREGLVDFHPLLAGYIALRGRARQKFMHRAWCGLMYNLSGTDSERAREQLTLHNALLLGVLKQRLAEAGEEFSPQLPPPARDHDARAYCPACLIQYAADLDECLYCPGVPLRKCTPPVRGG